MPSWPCSVVTSTNRSTDSVSGFCRPVRTLASLTGFSQRQHDVGEPEAADGVGHGVPSRTATCMMSSNLSYKYAERLGLSTETTAGGGRQRLVALRYCALASGTKISRITADQITV